MLRKEWKFDYTAPQLAQAAVEKTAFHTKQLDFWMSKRSEIMASIKEEGLEINEKVVLANLEIIGYSKSRDWDRGGEIVIRNDLRKALTETYEKLKYHTKNRDTYDGWTQILRAHASNSLALDIDDWLFFFGRDTTSDDDEDN